MFLHLCVILFIGGVVSAQGGLCDRDTPHMVMCGRYASYWYAFLFIDRNICALNERVVDLLSLYRNCNSSLICKLLISF